VPASPSRGVLVPVWLDTPRKRARLLSPVIDQRKLGRVSERWGVGWLWIALIRRVVEHQGEAIDESFLHHSPLWLFSAIISNVSHFEFTPATLSPTRGVYIPSTSPNDIFPTPLSWKGAITPSTITAHTCSLCYQFTVETMEACGEFSQQPLLQDPMLMSAPLSSVPTRYSYLILPRWLGRKGMDSLPIVFYSDFYCICWLCTTF